MINRPAGYVGICYASKPAGWLVDGVGQWLRQVEVVAHAGLLGVHIETVVLVGLHLQRDVLDYLQAVAVEAGALHGVVGHQSHFLYSDNSQNVGSHAVVAFVGLEAEMYVGVDCVVAVFLQLVGSDFVLLVEDFVVVNILPSLT